EIAVALLAGVKGLDGVASLNAKFGLAQGAMNGGGKRGEAMLEDEIRCAGLQSFDGHFFAERTGYENEWNVRRLFLCESQRAETIEGRQTMIREDQRG